MCAAVLGDHGEHPLRQVAEIVGQVPVDAPHHGAVGKIAGGGASYGHSLIINPWGEVLADGGDQAGVINAVIDLDEVGIARERIPSLRHDRPFGITEGVETKDTQ